MYITHNSIQPIIHLGNRLLTTIKRIVSSPVMTLCVLLLRFIAESAIPLCAGEGVRVGGERGECAAGGAGRGGDEAAGGGETAYFVVGRGDAPVGGVPDGDCARAGERLGEGGGEEGEEGEEEEHFGGAWWWKMR